MQFLIFLLFIPVFWVLILRPQQQQRRAHQAVVAGLEVGNKVMTVGGLIGTLTAVEAEVVRIDTGDGHGLTFGRTFVRSLVPEPADEPAIDLNEHADTVAGATDIETPAAETTTEPTTEVSP